MRRYLEKIVNGINNVNLNGGFGMRLKKNEKEAVDQMIDTLDYCPTVKAMLHRKKNDKRHLAALISVLFYPINLSKAWRVIGFPFDILAGLYRKIAKEDNPKYKRGFRENKH